MQIKRHCSRNFNITGNYLLKVLTTGTTSLLDILVRESIQNSLDAANPDSDFVQVDYSLAKFKSTDFNNELEGITDSLNERFAKGTYRSLVISDYNTTGLDGQYTLDGLEHFQDSGRFYKLVFDITRGNQNQGAGGSWGLGKTIYYQIGIGIVVFYTRIKNGNSFESRLAVSLVEDEQKTNPILPTIEGEIPTGIAWWGELNNNQDIIPITSDDKIKNILDILNIQEFSNEEIGTKIIIPYVNTNANFRDDSYLDRLIPSRRIHKNGETPLHVNFEQDILLYIKNSVYKWYMPRLNNLYGDKFLKVSLNKNDRDNQGQNIDADGEIPGVYELIRALYNIACDNEETYFNNKSNLTVIKESITNTNVFNSNKNIGKFVCVKVPKFMLKHRDTAQDPLVYLGLDSKNWDNTPIILKTRKPGMIINYSNINSKRIDIAQDDLVIGIFVVDKENILKRKFSKTSENINEPLSVEEYFRKGELADHFYWQDNKIFDSELNSVTPINLVEKLDGKIRTVLENTYSPQIIERERNFNTTLGDALGALLLPPEDYGQRPTENDSTSNSSSNNSSGSNGQTKKKTSLELYPEKTLYSNNIVSLLGKIHFGKGKSICKCILNIDSNQKGVISCEEWESQLDLSMPFQFDSIKFLNTNKTLIPAVNNKKIKYEENDCYVSFEYSAKNNCIGVNFSYDVKSKAKDVDVRFNIIFENKDYKPNLSCNVENE